MKKILSLMAVAGLLVAISSAADARGGPGGGASGFAPGQSFHTGGTLAGHPGASGYAPGHLKSAGSFRGASAFAPGHRFKR
jgi:hypothetical protein